MSSVVSMSLTLSTYDWRVDVFLSVILIEMLFVEVGVDLIGL